MREDNANLEFRKIPSLEFLYEVNENGTIIRNVKSKKRLKLKVEYHHTRTGYFMTFCTIKKKVRRIMVHSVVAECFLGKRPEGLEIDHINRDSLDNRYQNLRYVTHSEQMKNRVLSQRIIDSAKSNCANWNKKVSVPLFIDGRRYPSIYSAARFLASLYKKQVEHMRSKLKRRSKNIYGHDVVYLNAETRHCDHVKCGKE